MPISDDIQNDPTELQRFMRANIVFPTGMAAAGANMNDNLYWVRIVPGWALEPMPPFNPKPANGVIERSGNACNVYHFSCLGPAGHGTVNPGNAFAAYWVPFGANALGRTMLGLDAAIALTAKMDGCTFGLGNVAHDGACLAGHANAIAKGTGPLGFVVQDSAQHIMLAKAGITHFIDPFTYRFQRRDPKGEQVGWEGQGTTYGIRAGMSWTVYTQRIGGTAPNFVHRGIITGIRTG